jgi:putative heme-binding domain-containing protein
VLDWYDRYHCYQDAQADPQGVDRGYGRLYRVRYRDTPRAAPFDLEKESSEQLVERLSSDNLYFRELAQQVLGERSDPSVRAALLTQITDDKATFKSRMHAIFALVSSDYSLNDQELQQLLDSTEPAIRGWGVRTAGRMAMQRELSPELRTSVLARVADADPTVRLQVAIAAPRLGGGDVPATLGALAQSAEADDPLLPRIIWQNLYPRLPDESAVFAAFLERTSDWSPALQSLLARSCERLLDIPTEDGANGFRRLAAVIVRQHPELAAQLLEPIRRRLLSGELSETSGAALLQTFLRSPTAEPSLLERNIRQDIDALLGTAAAQEAAAEQLADGRLSVERRRELATVLASNRPDLLVKSLERCLQDSDLPEPLIAGLLDAAGRCEEPRIAEVVLERFAQLPASQRVRAVQLLTQRKGWSQSLVAAVSGGKLQTGDVDNNAVVRMSQHGDPMLSEVIAKLWGKVRTEADPNRRAVINRVWGVVHDRVGNPQQGRAVYQRVCGQCHLLHGEGNAVGPELTRNGRGSFEQLIVSVFDPNVVVGPAYLATTVLTTDGRVLSGILQEDAPQRIVLLQQGGKRDTIARDEIDEMQTTQISLMPEGLENQINDQELADLFSYLSVETPPNQQPATIIPGTPGRLVPK